jgi:AraC-like DNA-binding protein
MPQRKSGAFDGEWTAAPGTWNLLLMPELPPRPVRDPSPPTRLPFCIRTLGRIRRQPYHVTAGTYHDDAMLTVVRGGRGLYYRSGEVSTVSAGYVGLVLPSADPGLLMADPTLPYDHYYCRFSGREALRMAREIVAAHGARFFPSRRFGEAVTACEAMLAFEQRTHSGSVDWMSQADAALGGLLALLLTQRHSDAPPLSAAALRQYLVHHISRPFDLDEMASHFGVSRFHLSRKGRSLLGEPLAVASRRTRLDLARSLLAAAALDLSVAEISRRVGYDDPLYFSKTFRRHVGSSPRQYRAQHAAPGR